MENRCAFRLLCPAIFIAATFSLVVPIGAAAESGGLLIGKAAMGDWRSDAPGVRRKITVSDLPPPSSNILSINRARVVNRPADAQLRVLPGFKIELYAEAFRDPRFLLTAPNGDIFVVESRANQIKVLRDTNGDGKPDVTETFVERDLNKPFGNELWMSTNERDEIGEDLPPDYIGSVHPGGFYGWPWFYIGNHPDPRHTGKHPELADKVIVPDVLVQAHSATLNLCFYTGDQFPAEYKGDIFAAFHGSWNRMKRTGY